MGFGTNSVVTFYETDVCYTNRQNMSICVLFEGEEEQEQTHACGE
jgi:hypothetical protein